MGIIPICGSPLQIHPLLAFNCEGRSARGEAMERPGLVKLVNIEPPNAWSDLNKLWGYVSRSLVGPTSPVHHGMNAFILHVAPWATSSFSKISWISRSSSSYSVW
jgi:hypothetical protein